MCVALITGASCIAQSPPKLPQSAAVIAEIKETFTIGGKPIPPEIFRDFGDGNLADSKNIWVAVDAVAATKSNLYADHVSKQASWVVQKSAPDGDGAVEKTAYRYFGATNNGLLIAVASYSGGGSGDFFTLHVLHVVARHAFDFDGNVYERSELINLRRLPLGNRREGDVTISGNAITISTSGRVDAGASNTSKRQVIEAYRP